MKPIQYCDLWLYQITQCRKPSSSLWCLASSLFPFSLQHKPRRSGSCHHNSTKEEEGVFQSLHTVSEPDHPSPCRHWSYSYLHWVLCFCSTLPVHFRNRACLEMRYWGIMAPQWFCCRFEVAAALSPDNAQPPVFSCCYRKACKVNGPSARPDPRSGDKLSVCCLHTAWQVVSPDLESAIRLFWESFIPSVKASGQVWVTLLWAKALLHCYLLNGELFE